jgi:hypothetical protein
MALMVTLLLVGLPAGVARADWQTDRAQQIAAKAWNDPCGGKVGLWFTTPPQASWRAWAYPQLCIIGVSTAKPWRWEELCPVLLHEYGHLAGYEDPTNAEDHTHSRDPDDIMWPYVHYDRRCDDFGSAILGVPRPVLAPPAGGVGRAVTSSRSRRAATARRRAAAERARRGHRSGGHARARASGARERSGVGRHAAVGVGAVGEPGRYLPRPGAHRGEPGGVVQ